MRGGRTTHELGQGGPTDEKPDGTGSRWLEDISAERSLFWVRERNAVTTTDLAAGKRFDGLYYELLRGLDSDERFPVVQRRGELLYNFWRDADHPRGIWRRTPLEQYRKPEPTWEVLLRRPTG